MHYHAKMKVSLTMIAFICFIYMKEKEMSVSIKQQSWRSRSDPIRQFNQYYEYCMLNKMH